MNTSQAPPILTRVHRLDSIRLDETYFTGEGYLIDHPVVTSVGIFDYKNPDGSARRELRLPEHVFDEESLATYEGKPIIITHDAGRVDKDNVDGEHVGTMLSKGYQDGNDVRVKIVIHNIDQVKRSGLRELSLGYDLDLDETPGTWNGQPYDAIQTDIKVNHLALVKEARAGDQARLNIDGNSEHGGNKMNLKDKTSAATQNVVAAYKERRKRRLDEATNPFEEEGKPAAPPDGPAAEGQGVAPAAEGQGAEPVDKLQAVKDRRDRRDQDGDPETPEAAMGQISQMDEDIETLIDLLEELQASKDFSDTAPPEPNNEDEDIEPEGHGGGGATLTIQMDDVDAIVRERLKLGRLGDRLNLDGLEEMKPIDAKKAIIRKVNPGMRLDGKGATYINAAFDSAVAQVSPGTAKDANYQRRQMSNRADSKSPEPSGVTGASRARERMISRMMNGGTKE